MIKQNILMNLIDFLNIIKSIVILFLDRILIQNKIMLFKYFKIFQKINK